MDALIIALVTKLANWTIGKPFFAKVLSLVEIMDNRFDIDGDGKKEAILVELSRAGMVFGRRQFNRAIEMALIIVERR